MKKSPLLLSLTLFVLVLASSCVNQTKTEHKTPEPQQELSVPEKIAQAHGYQNWKKVNEIQFAFNFKGGNREFKRSWVWQPKQNTVQMQWDTLTYSYDRKKALDSISKRYDAGFINDRYWILLPFNLMWDKDAYTYETKENQPAPISADSLNLLTIVYESEGGYTPGDAYDIYFDKDYIIREWIFRRGNQSEPGSISTWDTYQEINGLKLVTNHSYPNGSRLFITDLKVKSD